MTRATTPKSPPKEWTYEEFLEKPESEHHPTEVIDGVIVEMPSPSGDHQWLLANLFRELDPVVQGGSFGIVIFAPADLLIRKRPKLQVREPDLMVFSTARTGIRGRREIRGIKVWEFTPELVVEVLSPGQTARTIADRLADYAEVGVPELWLVEPDAETVEVLTLRDGRYERAGLYGQGDTVLSAVLPGLALPVASVFA